MAEMLVTDPGTAGDRNDGTMGIGFEFQVPTDTVVRSLGIWDKDDDGLVGNHYVVIWRVSDQSNVAQVTVPLGTVAPLDAHFRWANMATPTTLDADTAYRIMSYYNWDDSFLDHSTTPQFSSLLSLTPAIPVKAYFTNTPPSPYFPIWSGAWGDNRAYTGPNLSTVLIPEPATLSLLAVAGLIMLVRAGIKRGVCRV